MNRHSSYLSRAVTIALVVAILAPITPIAVPRAHAILGVADTSFVTLIAVTDPITLGFYADVAANTTVSAGAEVEQSIIMQVLNGIAWTVAKAAIQSMTQSIVTWINSGFEGSPAFVTDLNTNLRQLGDAVAMQFVNDLLFDTGKTDTIRSPYVERIGQAIATGYYLSTSGDRLQARLEYTLQNFSRNPQAFLHGDFRQGGWNAWYATNSTCGNNPYCAQFAAHDEFIARLETQIDQRIQELSWGSGFLSWRGECSIAVDQQGNVHKDTDTTDLSDADKCLQHRINTPGSVVEDQLAGALGSPIRQLELADSINEIVGALVTQLVSQVISGSGLLGASDTPSGGGRSVLDQASNTSQVVANTTITNLTRTITDRRAQILSFEANWRKIRGAAIEAQAALERCIDRDANQALLDEEVEPLIVRADNAISRAQAAVLEADRIRTTLQGADANAVAQASDDYQALLALVTTAEIAESVTESSSNENMGESLYLRMQEIEDDACRIGRLPD